MRIKPSPFMRMCNRIDRRLLGTTNCIEDEVMQSIASMVNYDGHIDYLVEHVMGRVTTEVNTLQINYPDVVTYRVSMSYEDRSVEPENGRIYRRVNVNYTASRLPVAVLVAYVRLCRQAGRAV